MDRVTYIYIITLVIQHNGQGNPYTAPWTGALIDSVANSAPWSRATPTGQHHEPRQAQLHHRTQHSSRCWLATFPNMLITSTRMRAMSTPYISQPVTSDHLILSMKRGISNIHGAARQVNSMHLERYSSGIHGTEAKPHMMHP